MTAVRAVTDSEQTPWRPGRLGRMLEACTCWDRYDKSLWATCPIHGHLHRDNTVNTAPNPAPETGSSR